MEESIQTTSTPIETPPASPAPSQPAAPAPNVFGSPAEHGYSDPSRALAGNAQTQAREAAEAKAPPTAKPGQAQQPKFGKFTAPDLRPKETVEAKTADKPPVGQRFGLSEERKQQLAAELKARKSGEQVAAPATAPAQVKAEPAVDPVKRASEFVGNYFDDDGDVGDLLGRLYDSDYGRYEKLVSHVVANNRDHALRLLGAVNGPHRDDPEFMHLPEELRQTAADLRPDIWESLSFAAPHDQIFHLEREAQLQQIEQREWEEQVTQEQETRARVQKEGVEAIERMSAPYERQLRESIKDLTPLAGELGLSDFENRLLKVVFGEMMDDPQYGQAKKNIDHLLRLAPQLKAQGRTLDAQKCHMYAKTLADEFTREFTSILNDFAYPLRGILRDAKAYREQQAKAVEQNTQPDLAPFEPGDQIVGTRFFYNKTRSR